MKSLDENAFTLTETLITVIILGIVAALLVPNLIKNQVENANRTKVKKAMASYEKAINYMIIENDIRETESLRELGQNNCQYTREYFKTVKDGSTNCIFKTADRVWWDITDITNPILILKESQTQKETDELRTLAKNINDNTVFALVGRFDDLGTLRINDNAYEQGLENNFTNQKYVGKLWYFITQSTSVLTGIQKCQAEGATTCTITSNGISVTYTKITTNDDTFVDYNCSYNRETDIRTCQGYTSVALKGDYWISDNLGKISAVNAKSEQTCKTSIYSECTTEGDYYEAARQMCIKLGGHLATIAELSIAKDYGKLTGSTGSWFWASEEYLSSSAYRLNNDDGRVNPNSKRSSNYMFLCVGD